jgi:membrane protein YdbS with pleckstrin-like domain
MLRRRREREALGGTLESIYPRRPDDPYSAHVPEHERAEGESAEAEPVAPVRPSLLVRIGARLDKWRKAYLPLPDEIVGEHLGHGERVIHNDHPSLRAFLIKHGLLVAGLFIAAIVMILTMFDGSLVASAAALLLVSLVLLALVLARLSERYTSYVITNVRIMRIAGVVTRRVHSIPWMRVTDLSFDQSWTGRMFGYATLHIESANEDSGLRDLEGVSKPIQFNKYLVDMVVAKQGPTAPGWEEIGQAAPAGVILGQRRVGLRERVREVRRRRRDERAALAAAEAAQTYPRPVSRRGRGAPPAAPRGERRYPDPRRAYVPPDEPPGGQPPDEALAPGAPGETTELPPGAAPRESQNDSPRDPLREDPESSVPWGREER